MRSLIILPGTALVLIPTVILVASKNLKCPPQLASPTEIWFWLVLLAAGIGFTLISWSIALFMQVGKGTPAPWEPPQKLVIRGPYRYVRNPMIGGALFILLAQAMLFHSWPIAIWMVIFFASNTVYFSLSEEKGLEKRFGDDYRVYKTHVPRWLPRLRAWIQEDDAETWNS